MVSTNHTGEVVNVQDANQFVPGKSQFMCGFFACYIARSMAKVNQSPTLNAAQISSFAVQAYHQFNGSNYPENMNGMSDEQEYELLQQIGLHYQRIGLNIPQVKSWIFQGYPLLISVLEASVRDLDLGGTSPYPWNPQGNHMLLVTGVAENGNVLVRDSANCANLFDPASLRPGPRKYNAAALELVSATIVVPPWLPRPILH